MELFTSQISEPNRNVLDHVQRRVTTPMNDALMALYTVEEVKKTLFSVGDPKAPVRMAYMLFFTSGFGPC